MVKRAVEVPNECTWSSAQEKLHNCVVQVVAQIVKFNWQEPYSAQEQYESYGSGFFIDADGYVLTTAHVVEAASTVWIHIPHFGKRSIFVDVIGFCPDRDMALLRVRDDERAYIKEHIGDFKHVSFGDSDKVMRTDPVLALGYPLGDYGIKSSTGIVSGRESFDGYSMLQITAPINPGNSGGPVVDAQGKVIGIAVAIVKGSQNIGFAIPVNELKIILQDLYVLAFVRRGSLGVQFNYATDDHARFFGNPVPAGIYIGNVMPGSLLAEVGVQEGDMLYEFNGYRLDGFGDATVPWSVDKVSLSDLVNRLKNNTKVKLVMYRYGKRLDFSIVFALTKPYPIRKIYPQYEDVDYEVLGGMVIMELAENHLQVLAKKMPFIVEYAKFENRTKHVLVITHVIGGSLAQRTRSLAPGFIIAEVNGKKVKTLESLRKAIRSDEESTLLTIKTTQNIFVVLNWTDIVFHEERLSLELGYPLSKTMLKMIRRRS